MLVLNRGRNVCSRPDPMAVALDLQTELLVIYLQIAVGAAHDRRRHDLLHVLRHHPDIGPVAAVVAKSIKAKTVIEIAEKGDVVLEPDVRAPSATTTAAAASTASAVTSASPDVATATAASVHSATTPAAGAHLGSMTAASPCVTTVTAAAIGVRDMVAAA